MAKKKVFDPSNDDGPDLPNPETEPVGIPWSLPPTPAFGDPKELQPAKSQRSTGRGCPLCSGDLKLFEYIKEDDLVIVQCKTCKRKWHEPDLESDELYRIIPPDYILRTMNRVDRGAILRARNGG